MQAQLVPRFFAEFLVSLFVIPFVELLKVVTELEVKDPSVLQLPNHNAPVSYTHLTLPTNREV